MKRIGLVTGGSRGIGLGIAEALASSGYDLALCGRRPPETAAEVLDRLEKRGARSRYFQADISVSEEREMLLAQVRRSLGSLHLLVNNAGVAPSERRDLLEASEESFRQVLSVNLEGPYFLTQRAARWMIEQSRQNPEYRGAVINVSSISAEVASTNRGEYCISKAGLAMATQLWAVRLAEYDIPVYELRPGLIRTDMTEPVKEKYDRLIEDGLLLQSRWGTPADVGKAVAALASGSFSYSTGQVIKIDGGMLIRRL